MRRHLRQTDCFCILLYRVQNHSFGDPVAPSCPPGIRIGTIFQSKAQLRRPKDLWQL